MFVVYTTGQSGVIDGDVEERLEGCRRVMNMLQYGQERVERGRG